MARARSPLRFSWPKDSPTEVSFSIGRLAKDFENFAPALAACTTILQDDLEERFATGTDPNGQPWVDWKEGYRKDAESYPNREIFADRASLVRDENMLNSMRNPSQWTVDHENIYLNTAGFDPKWRWHNYGLKKVRSRGGRLPQREFLGTSEDGKLKVIAAFGAWVDGKVVEATSSKGMPFFRHSERGGNALNPGQFSKATY